MVAQPSDYTKTAGSYTIKWWFLWYENYISIKIKLQSFSPVIFEDYFPRQTQKSPLSLFHRGNTIMSYKAQSINLLQKSIRHILMPYSVLTWFNPSQLQDSWLHWNTSPSGLLSWFWLLRQPALLDCQVLSETVTMSSFPNCQALMNSKFW